MNSLHSLGFGILPRIFNSLSLLGEKKKKKKRVGLKPQNYFISFSFLCCLEPLYSTSINYSISVFEKHLPGCQIPVAEKLDGARNQSLCAKYCCWLHSLSLRAGRSLIFCSSVKRWQDVKMPCEVAVM